jgi:hypothetical protein
LALQLSFPFKPTVSDYKAWKDNRPVSNPQITDCQFSEAIDKFHLTEDTQSYLLRLLSNNKTEIEVAKLPAVEQPDSITNPLFLEIAG